MRTLLFLLSYSTFAFALACSGSRTATDEGEDAAAGVDRAASDCDPHRAPCRATLSCSVGTREGIDLATGHVQRLDDPQSRADVECYLGRFNILQSFGPSRGGIHDDTGGVCQIGTVSAEAGFAPTRFANVTDVPADLSLCPCRADGDCWREYVHCGVNATPYEGSVCAGWGFLTQPRDGKQLYRLRIVDDGLQSGDDSSGMFAESRTAYLTIEWVAVDV